MPILNKVIKFVVKSGGKRIRPLFTYYLGSAHGLQDGELLKLGALLEIVHAASLLHDDVVDGAVERRAKPTGARLFGNKQVVLSGDHLLASGLKYLNTMNNPAYMTIFTDSIQALTTAELLQMQHHFDLKTGQKTHEAIVDGKTATLFRAAGALVATMQGGTQDFYQSETAALGTLFGRYFQERDDHLDYFDAARLKKKGLQDFANGIVTAPLNALLLCVNKVEKLELQQAWEKARISGQPRSEKTILSLMKKYAIEQRSLENLRITERLILAKLANLPEKRPREVITAEFQKILAVRAA